MDLAWVLKYFHRMGVQDEIFLQVSSFLHSTNQLLSLSLLKSKPLMEEIRNLSFDRMLTAATRLTEIDPVAVATLNPIAVGIGMDDDPPQCGPEIHNLLWWLRHHGPGPWPTKETIEKALTMIRAMNEYFVACQVVNKTKRNEMRMEAAKQFTQTVQRMAGREKAVVAA
jgi:hypothetical protein